MLKRRLFTSLISSTPFRNAATVQTNQRSCSTIIGSTIQQSIFAQHRELGWFSGHHILRAYSLLSLNDLRDNKGARKPNTRKGRGIGSGKGKTAGRGHKGQKARGTMKFGFEGGQTPLRRRLPKRGFNNPFSLTFQPIGLGKVAKLINAGKIDSSELITMKTLKWENKLEMVSD
ncbi:unnamed protein product [Cuscuta europaea]|uniref:Ribosomal protein L18e/L15P domain-containing protein n=1 Tax=Cuscuta europaea TaxID=41803 RepID=A0A9P0ZLB0_CUSEU|nr:unnamed protein product [Cuscuta europaea]